MAHAFPFVVHLTYIVGGYMLLIKVRNGSWRMDSRPTMTRGWSAVFPQPHSARHDPPEPFPAWANQHAEKEAWLNRS